MAKACPEAGIEDGAADSTADVVITPYRDGPLIVRGPVRIVDDAGREIDAGRRTIALCRCGRSALKPFCDGSHRAVGFRADSADQRKSAGLRPSKLG
jgi:CDGSH-type Zn-finger protein